MAAFIGATLAFVMSPGPDTVLVLRYTISSGRGVGSAAVAGVQLGLAGHTLLAVVGLSVVIASSPNLFALIAIAGAIYIAWLGIQGIRMGIVRIEEVTGAGISHAKALRDAMLTNLLNPKVILLFLALVPNFVDVDRGHVTSQLGRPWHHTDHRQYALAATPCICRRLDPKTPRPTPDSAHHQLDHGDGPDRHRDPHAC